jgi:hypothetical protein
MKKDGKAEVVLPCICICVCCQSKHRGVYQTSETKQSAICTPVNCRLSRNRVELTVSA